MMAQVMKHYEVAPIQWSTWNETFVSVDPEMVNISQPPTIEQPSTIATVVWNDFFDPISPNTKPFLINSNDQMRLDLPPPSHLDTEDFNETTNSFKLFQLKDFTISPDEGVNDAAISGMDPITGKPLSLTAEQRHTLKLYGHIHVPSKRFSYSNKKQNHTWQISRSIYSGTKTIVDDFQTHGIGGGILNHMLYSLDSLSLTIKSQQESLFISFGSAVRSIRSAIMSFYNGAIQSIKSYDQQKYSSDAMDHLLHIARESYVQKQFMSIEKESNVIWMFPPDDIHSHSSQHKKNSEEMIDLLWDALLIDAEWTLGAKPTREQIIGAGHAKEQLDKFYRLSHESQYLEEKNQNRRTDEETIAQQSTTAAQSFLKQRQQSDHNHQQGIKVFEKNGKMFGEYKDYIIESLQAKQIQATLQRQDEELVTTGTQTQQLDEWRIKRPLLSHSSEWNDRKHKQLMAKLQLELRTTFDERLIATLKEHNLERMAYIQYFRNEFDTKHQSSLQMKLSKVRIPLPPRIFNVLRIQSRTANPEHTKVPMSFDKPWWRLRSTFLTFWSTTKLLIGDGFHYLTMGPLSFRALLSKDVYFETQTLRSRLSRFWSTLSDIRTKFEAEPDTGLIGKFITRFFLHAYLGMKEVVGTTWICLFMTVGTVLFSSVAAICITISPIIGLLWAVLVAMCDLVIYDSSLSYVLLDYSLNIPDNDNKHLLQKHYPSPGIHSSEAYSPIMKCCIIAPFDLIWGIIKAVIALTSSFVVHPTIAIVRIAFSSIRASIRLFRDMLTWPILYSYARVPTATHNSWLCYRTHGPGLASEQYFRLPLWSAKMAVLLKLDMIRLDLHDQLRTKEMQRPFQEYVNTFKDLEQLGIRVQTNVESPCKQAIQLVELHRKLTDNIIIDMEWNIHCPNNIDFDSNASRSSIQKTSQSVWERCSRTFIEHHPDYMTNKRIEALNRVEPNVLAPKDFDAKMIQHLHAFVKNRNLSNARTSPLQKIVDSIVPTYAIWISQKSYRRILLNRAVILPHDALDRFRLSQQELDELWKFTVAMVESYGTIIQTELIQLATDSEWLTKEDGEIVSQSYYDKDYDSSAIISYHIICELFGETSMTQSLEEIDESLILDAGIAIEDRHLQFWLHNTSDNHSCLDDPERFLHPRK